MATQYAIAVDYWNKDGELDTGFVRLECEVLKVFADTYNVQDIKFVRDEKEVTYFSKVNKELVEGLVNKFNQIFPNDLTSYHKFELVTVKNGWLYKEDICEEFFK